MSQAPKRKTSKSKRNMRRSHDFLTPVLSNACPNCGASVLSHHVCRECGYYRGRKVLNVKEA
jgi:large subunit ribosomal protein L32